MATGIAGGMLLDGARRFARGDRPRLEDLLLTPANVVRVTEQLAQLRGAAMKMGQLISMEAGDILPPELGAIMARLRADAEPMPRQQVQAVLDGAWGPGWQQRLESFSFRPIAAASIGQVHRAFTRDGRDLAVKIQYPGVRRSIDSDVDNVATLLRMSGMVPRHLDVAPLLGEAKRQLHEEADYIREGAQLTRFHTLLAGDDAYVVPTFDPEFSGPSVLAMSFVEGVPIETLAEGAQDRRDAAMASLIALVLRELFEFGVMQTDPNFANYRYQPDTGKLVLLDFGAARAVAQSTVDGYRHLLRAGLSGSRDAVRQAAISVGFLGDAAVARHGALIDRMIDVILVELNRTGPFDFGDRAFVGVLRDQGMAMAADRDTWHVPPVDTLFVQRKISGTALLAARLKARVDVRAMVLQALPGEGA